MVHELTSHEHILKALLKVNPEQRLAILKTADKNLIKCLCGCALNLVKGNVPVTPILRRKLGKYKKSIRALAHRRGSWKAKKKVLLQRGGGFVPLLLGPILSAVLTSVLN